MEIEIERGVGKGGGGPSECLESEEWMLRRRYRSGGKGGRREQRSTVAGTEAEPKTDGSGGGGRVARRAPYHVGKREGGIGD